MEISAARGRVRSSLALQPVSTPLPSALLACKEVSLTLSEFWSDIATSDVFFLLSGSYQRPAEEARAARCPELRSRGAEASCNNQAQLRALRIFDTTEIGRAQDSVPPPLFLSRSLFLLPPHTPPTFYSQWPRTFSLAGKRKSHYRIMVHLASPTGSPAITTGFLTALASV